MKKLKFSFALIFMNFLLFCGTSWGESEPNNTYLQASVISPNSTDSGALNEQSQSQNADNDDWWQVTLPSDGSFYIEANASSNLDVDLYIYDVDGQSIISTGSKYGTKESAQHLALKAATYYFRAYRSSGTGTYTVQTLFTPALYSNDSEPNNSYETAQTLNLNSETTGHIRYYSNFSTDYDDYWKVTIPYDGSLTVSTESDSADIDLYIYDVDGSTIIKTASVYGLTETIEYPNLMPGVYYVRVYSSSKQGGYKINSVYTQTSINGITTNDNEKNDDYLSAVNWISFNNDGNSTSYGHLGYYSNFYSDNDDYWAITTTTDGKLVINTISTATLDVDLYMYDINGSTIIKTASVYGTNEQLTFENLAAGKYYIRTYRSGYGSYIITAEFSTPSMPNDSEPNDEFAQAVSIVAETRMTGHLGYFSNNHTDYDDYYVINLASEWDSLYVRMDSETSLDADLYLYDNSSTIIATAGAYGTKEILKYGKISAGTYFIRAYRSTAQGSYAIKFSNRFIADLLTDVKKEDVEIIPTTYSLSQNYPNPFNPTTTIKYDLPKDSRVSLKVYTILGQEVAALIDKEMSAGSYSFDFDASNLSNGIYFYRLDAGTFSMTKKMILLK